MAKQVTPSNDEAINIDLGDVKSAQQVLLLQAQALTSMAKSLGGDFSEAITVLQQVTGRVIITGVGKSGHVAGKIAATMASTGTPAQFVHANEASHGDLGMITEQDAVIAISNSGESAELGDMIAYTRRFKIPLIAITAQKAGTLAQAADIALVFPAFKEGCPMGLAPTTSTTLTMALGDALAVTLLQAKGFTSSDFKIFHPGGKLGQQLKKVGDLMHDKSETPLVPMGTQMGAALITMSEKNFGLVGVTDAQNILTGIVTDGDLRRHMSDALLKQPVEQVMTPNPLTIGPEQLASEALHIMNEKAITVLFVTDNGAPAGIIRLHDCLKTGIA